MKRRAIEVVSAYLLLTSIVGWGLSRRVAGQTTHPQALTGEERVRQSRAEAQQLERDGTVQKKAILKQMEERMAKIRRKIEQEEAERKTPEGQARLKAESEKRAEQSRQRHAARIRDYGEDWGARQALAVSDQQWVVIQPQYKHVEYLLAQLRRVYDVAIKMVFVGGTPALVQSGGAVPIPANAGGGTQTSVDANSPTGRGQLIPLEKLKADVALCLTAGNELRELAENKGSRQEIEKRLEVVRKVRQELLEELVKARQELRGVTDPRQQAVLSLMGWLD